MTKFKANGRAIAAKRVLRDMTQQGLADKTGFSLSTIQKIEGGAKDGSIDSVAKIAEVLGSTVDELIEKEGPA